VDHQSWVDQALRVPQQSQVVWNHFWQGKHRQLDMEHRALAHVAQLPANVAGCVLG